MDGSRTGVEEYTLGVLDSMLKMNTGDEFVLFANSRKPMKLPGFSGNAATKSFRFPNKLFNFSLKFLDFPKIDRIIKADVLFVPSFRLTPCSIKTPLAVTIHDLSFVRHPEYFSRGRRIWHSFMEPKKLAKRADVIITDSKTTAGDVEKIYGINKSKIKTVYLGINPQMRKIDSASEIVREIKKRYDLPDKFILFLGTLEPRKNLFGLLRAYTLARESGFDHKLVIAGVRGWIKKDFFEELKKNPFAKDIILTGFVEDIHKPALYSLADLFVYPSFYEGFGFPPLEALACGTPVITSYNSAIPEVAGKWATLVNPYDVDELAAVIIERLREPVKVDEKVSQEVKETYNWEKAGRETLEILKMI